MTENINILKINTDNILITSKVHIVVNYKFLIVWQNISTHSCSPIYSKYFNLILAQMFLSILISIPKIVIKSFIKTFYSIIFPNSMSSLEAGRILNLNDKFTKDELKSKYNNYYHINSNNNNGSEYIRSKIKNAYDYLRYQ